VAACSCSRDHVKVYSVTPRRLYSGAAAGGSDVDTSSVLAVETLVGIYCGDKLPGPQMSDERSSEMRVRLTTNERGVEAGFRAKYEFVEKSPRTSAYHTHTHTHRIYHTVYTDIAVRSVTCLTATGTHMPYRITQCYLPLDRGDIPAFKH